MQPVLALTLLMLPALHGVHTMAFGRLEKVPATHEPQNDEPVEPVK